jgi:methane monooxygenase PmoA-like
MKTLLALISLLSLCTLAGVLSERLVAAEAPGEVAVKIADNHIDFLAAGELVGRYNKAESVAKPYFWPLNAAGGVPVTRGWPMTEKAPGGSSDHVHQKSAWFCHGDIIPDGIEVKDKIKGIVGADFWSEARGHGKIVCTRVGEPKNSKGHVAVPTHNEWRTADGIKILDEDRTIHLYDFAGTRLLVFDIDLRATGAPLTFGDTKEGSFGVRVNDLIREDKGNGKLENADGKVGEKACWGQKSAWCDYSGTVADKKVGIAILDDPANPYPAYWHSRGYGLMAANPFGRARSGFPAAKGNTELVKLAKGDHLKLRYGLLIHPGDAKEGKVAEYFDRFVKLKN